MFSIISNALVDVFIPGVKPFTPSFAKSTILSSTLVNPFNPSCSVSKSLISFLPAFA